MKTKTRRNFLKHTGLAAMALATGCSTTGNNSGNLVLARNKREILPNMLGKYDIGKRTQKDSKYEAPFFSAGNHIYYGENGEGIIEPDGTQMPLIIYDRRDIQQNTDFNTNQTIFKPKHAYTPTLVSNDQDGFVDGLPLKMWGPHGIRAGISTFTDLEPRMQKRGRGIGIGTTNENDACYEMDFLHIPSKGNFFIVGVGDTGETGNRYKALDWYMVPVKDGSIKLDYDTGRITLINENNIYRPEHLSKGQMNSFLNRQEIVEGDDMINAKGLLNLAEPNPITGETLEFVKPSRN